MTATAAVEPSSPGPARKSKRAVRTAPLLAPAVGVLLVWMIVPLAMTIWFSLQRYNLLNPFISGFAGLDNYRFLITDPALRDWLVGLGVHFDGEKPKVGGLSLELMAGAAGAVIVIIAGTLLAKRKALAAEAAGQRTES